MDVLKVVLLVLSIALFARATDSDLTAAILASGGPFSPNNLIVCVSDFTAPFPRLRGEGPLIRLIQDTPGAPVSLNTDTMLTNESGMTQSPFRPEPSRFRPPPLDFITIAQLMNMFGRDIEMTIQRVFDPGNEAVPDPCQLSVGEQIADNNQMSANEIVEFIKNRIEAVTPQNLTITDDIENDLIFLFQGLNCYVESEWVDAGEAFFPRYFAGTSCIRRNCALPDRAGMYCRPDLSAGALRNITALRWDCCNGFTVKPPDPTNPSPFASWRNGQLPQELFPSPQCGWRKITFPVVCDCDCVCDE